MNNRAYYGWYIVAALAITETISWGVLYYSFSVFLTPMEQEFGWTRAQLTGAFSLSLVVVGVTAYPIGGWVDRNGGRWLMTIGSILATLLVVAWAYTQTLWQFYAVWLGLGLCSAMVLYDTAFIVVSQWFTRQRARALVIITFAAGLASTIFLPLSDLLLRNFGWRGAVLFLALLLGVVTIPLHAFVLRHRPQELGLQPDGVELPTGVVLEPPRGVSVRSAITERTFWLLTGAFCLLAMSAAAMRFHFIPYMTSVGIDQTTAARAAGLIGLTSVGGRVFFAFIEQRLTRGAMLIAVFTLQAAAIAVLLGGTSATLLLGFILGFGAAQGAATLIRPALLTDLYGVAHFGRISAVMGFAMMFFQTSAPWIASVIFDLRDSYTLVIWAVTGTAIAAAVCAAIAQWQMNATRIKLGESNAPVS